MTKREQVAAVLRKNSMHPDEIELGAEIEKYAREMAAGLAKKNGSSLLMLPTYVSLTDHLPLGQSAIVIDAGGTNLRVGRVSFGKDGMIDVPHFEKHPMPGSLSPISKDRLFEEIARKVLPLLTDGDAIGFCFSYVFESTPDRDGIIDAMSKEVEVSDIGGAAACASLEAALVALGADGKRRYVMINDTVATLLGAKAVHIEKPYATYVGMILGTGFNVCYVEKTQEIGKIPPGSYQPDNMVINMESGIYTGLAQGRVDRLVDSGSQIPGDHVFEKMISGGYFGEVLYGSLALMCDAGLFTEAAAGTIRSMDTVSLREVTLYIEGKAERGSVYSTIAKNSDDRQVLDAVLDLLYERCARIITLMLGGILHKTKAGGDPASPVCVCIEGTTFYRSPLLRTHLNALLQDYVAGSMGQHMELVRTDDTTLIGTALAALTNG